MTRRFLLAIAGALAICVLTLGVLALLPAPPGITKTNYDRIENGMMKAQVDEIFGQKGFRSLATGNKGTPFVWIANDGSFASVEFVDDCVVEMQWVEANEKISARIRRWLRLN